MQTQILGLVTPLMALFFAVTFAMLWRLGRMKRYVLGFAVAYVFFPLGFLVTHFLPPEAIFTFHATHLFYSLANTFLMASICARAGQRLHLPSMAVIYLLTALALVLAISLSNDAGPRVIIVNIGYGAMTLMAFTTMLQSRPRETIDIFIVALMALGAADFLLRPVITLLFERSIPAEVYRDSVYYSLIGLALGLKAVTSALTLIIATISDLTTAMRERSEIDPLTGLHNRAAFEEAMRGLLPKAQSEGLPLSLIVADIDHFKRVNDIWGHQAGDEAIAAFGELVRKAVRATDLCGRVGGEEFCILVYNCELSAAEGLADRIRRKFTEVELAALSPDIRLTASFGVTQWRPGEAYGKMFARADAALYRAKASGRDCVVNSDAVAPAQTPLSPASDEFDIERLIAQR